MENINNEQIYFRDEYDCNLARYLNLPEYFNKAGKKITVKFYYKLIKNLENTPNDKNSLINHVKFVLNQMNYCKTYIKELLAIYIYQILDTQQSIDILLSNKKFKTAVIRKFTEITECPDDGICEQFREYMLNNFVINKRFLSVKRNTDYKKRMFRIYMRTIVICNKWHYDILEKRYAPGGNGAIEAENHFACLSSTIKLY